MARSKKDKTVETPVELTHDALGLFEENGRWMIAHVRFNPVTMQAELVAKIPSDGNREDAIQRFKVTAINLNIVG